MSIIGIDFGTTNSLTAVWKDKSIGDVPLKLSAPRDAYLLMDESSIKKAELTAYCTKSWVEAGNS